MNDLLQQIKTLAGKLKPSTVSYNRRGFRPSHDWKIILASTFIALVLVAAFSFYFYTLVDGGKIFTVVDDASMTEVKINSNLLSTVVGDINTRATTFANTRENGVSYGDPSL